MTPVEVERERIADILWGLLRRWRDSPDSASVAVVSVLDEALREIARGDAQTSDRARSQGQELGRSPRITRGGRRSQKKSKV